ncbi:MAG: DNA polymerase III subunit gamma/tau [Myxococcota bacterium]
MSYTVLARKYRPQAFKDLVGQEHVAKTLSNAIETDRVAHAFLFTGVRGVGKTTTARLLAKALNCVTGPTPTPCNECAMCTEITAGVDLDVLEMDGASNNSVEDVRRLQESIPYRPSRDRLKIVIVDEVHMLSTGAFNAFLKTLEEPPPHVKFIFATTESHKVPITIRSRCQRYDFRLIPQAVISSRVREILASEGITTDDETVSIVAREAAGSMRDALTLLDQIVAFGGTDLKADEVAKTLGIAGRAVVREVCRAILEADGKAALLGVDALATQGLDILHFAKQVLDYFRDLVVLRVAGDSALVSVSDEELTSAQVLAEAHDPLELQRSFSSLSLLVEDVGRSATPKTVLEMGLVRLATRPPLRQVGELMDRLEALERRMGGGGGPSSGQGRGPRRRSPQDAPSTPRSMPRHEPENRNPAHASARSTLRGNPPVFGESVFGESVSTEPVSTEPVSTEPVSTEPVSAESVRAESVRTPFVPADSPAPPSPGAGTASAGTAHGRTPSDPRGAASARHPSESREHPDSSGEATKQPKAPAVVEVPIGEQSLMAVWERILHHVRESRPALAAILEHGAPRTIDRQKLLVAFPKGSFFGTQASDPESRHGLAQCAEKVIGAQPKVEIEFSADSNGQGRTLADVDHQRRADARDEKRRQALSHPAVVDAIQVFDVRPDAVKVQVE